jgi:hypothetical protein
LSRFDYGIGKPSDAGLKCPTCGGPVQIERVRQELNPPFVQPGGPIVRRATCEAGHVTWADDEPEES